MPSVIPLGNNIQAFAVINAEYYFKTDMHLSKVINTSHKMSSLYYRVIPYILPNKQSIGHDFSQRWHGGLNVAPLISVGNGLSYTMSNCMRHERAKRSECAPRYYYTSWPKGVVHGLMYHSCEPIRMQGFEVNKYKGE